jgi:hypothetical protein
LFSIFHRALQGESRKQNKCFIDHTAWKWGPHVYLTPDTGATLQKFQCVARLSSGRNGPDITANGRNKRNVLRV